jgi:hypothetical protein
VHTPEQQPAGTASPRVQHVQNYVLYDTTQTAHLIRSQW